jgi:hypothetical protein
VIGSLRAAYGPSWQQNSLGLWPILFSLSLNKDAVGRQLRHGNDHAQRCQPAASK